MTENIQIVKILDGEVDGAFSTLLRHKGVRILLDCGFPADLSSAKYEAHHEQLSQVDIVLVTSSAFEHSGALCWLLNKYNHIVG